MKRRTRRRSANAVIEYCRQIEFKPQVALMCGVGTTHHDADALIEEWPRLEIEGWEPNPSSFKCVESTFPGRVRPVALSDSDRIRILWYKETHKDGGSLIQPDESCVAVSVRTDTLDEAVGVPAPIDGNGLLWLDCEGSELAVLDGGKKFIESHIKMINIELTGRPKSKMWCSITETHEMLKYLGFHFMWAHTTRIARSQFDAIYVHHSIASPSHCMFPWALLDKGKNL